MAASDWLDGWEVECRDDLLWRSIIEDSPGAALFTGALAELSRLRHHLSQNRSESCNCTN